MCPDCGKVLRKPPRKQMENGIKRYYHSSHCSTRMVAVRIQLAYPYASRKW